jgi:hypothetical protein
MSNEYKDWMTDNYNEILEAIPETFYANLTLPERITLLVKQWNLAIKILNGLDEDECRRVKWTDEYPEEFPNE